MRKLALAAIVWGFTRASVSWAQVPEASTSLQAIPALTARVIDQTQTLSSSELQNLQTQLKALEDTRGTQIVVLIVSSTQPEDIFSYSNRVANSWKMGRRDLGDGVLIVVAKNDRKLRIEIAKSLEGAIPDLAASDIIKESMTPAFKQGQYGQGLQAGISQLSARLVKENLPAPTAASGAFNHLNQSFDPLQLLLFSVFAIPAIGAIARQMLGNKLGTLAVGVGAGTLGWFMTASLTIAGVAGVIAVLIVLLASLKGMGIPTHTDGGWVSSRGSGSGFGGGEFNSGGGGDFGGGGASGDW